MHCVGIFESAVEVISRLSSGKGSGTNDAVTVQIAKVQLLCVPRRLLNAAEDPGPCPVVRAEFHLSVKPAQKQQQQQLWCARAPIR